VGRRLLSPVATAISLIALVAPSAADAKARLQVRVAGTTARVVVTDNRPRQVRLLVDGRVVASGHRRRLSRVVKRLAPGRHVVVVRGRHRRTLARKAFVVRAVPTVEVVAPSVLVRPAVLSVRVVAPEGSVRGIVQLEAAASVSGGRVGWVDFVVDGVVVGSATVAPYRVGWDAAGVAAGQHRLVAVAHGVDGATATSAAVIVTSDATPRYTVEASAYPSLAEAVAALPASGGSVHLAAGSYPVQELAIGSHVQLIGDGPGRTILRAPDGSNYSSMLRIAGSDVAIQNLTIDGNGAAQTGGAGWAIQIRGRSDHVLLRRLAIRAPFRVAVYAWGSYRDVSVQDSTIDGAGRAHAGVQYAQGIADAVNSDSSVLRTTITRFTDYGISFYPWLEGTTYPAPRALAADNTITDITDPTVADGTSEGGIWSGGHDAVIRDNTIARTGWDGIETFGDSQNARIDHNTITDTPFGIYLEHETSDSLIQHNTISRVHLGINIEWRYGGKGSQRQTIRQNTITAAEEGINVDVGADQNRIENNTITDTTVFGIRLQGTSHNLVRGNNLRRSGPHGAILETTGQTDTGNPAPPTHNTITNNDCRNGGSIHLIAPTSTATDNLT
jgi:parallel beta-helix repeat protein